MSGCHVTGPYLTICRSNFTDVSSSESWWTLNLSSATTWPITAQRQTAADQSGSSRRHYRILKSCVTCLIFSLMGNMLVWFRHSSYTIHLIKYDINWYVKFWFCNKLIFRINFLFKSRAAVWHLTVNSSVCFLSFLSNWSSSVKPQWTDLPAAHRFRSWQPDCGRISHVITDLGSSLHGVSQVTHHHLGLVLLLVEAGQPVESLGQIRTRSDPYYKHVITITEPDRNQFRIIFWENFLHEPEGCFSVSVKVCLVCWCELFTLDLDWL